jgi:hypothetical protein
MLVFCHIAFCAEGAAFSCCDPLEKKLEERLLEHCFTETIKEGIAAPLAELLATVHPERVTFEAMLPCTV